jgi:hypothetical protein
MNEDLKEMSFAERVALRQRMAAEERERVHVLPSGHKLEHIGGSSYKLLDADGNPLRYLRAETVEYKPTLEEQRRAMQ